MELSGVKIINNQSSIINEKPLILAVETSGRLGSVALAAGEKLLGEKQFSGPMRHSTEIFPDIVGLLERFNKKPADLEQVYISIGPGSFTGLRIAVTIAKSMALANQAKLVRRPFGGIIAVDTLDCIAANIIDFARSSLPQLNTQNSTLKTDERLAVILDAKRGQFFIAVYEQTTQSGLSFLRKPSEISKKFRGPSPGNPSDFSGQESSNRCLFTKIQPDCLMTASEFVSRFAAQPACSEQSRAIALIGEGLVYYRNNFNAPNLRFLDEKYWNPSAANVHKLGRQKALRGEFADPLTLVPNYIRGPDVKVSFKC
jgi:tRNA threonylcarbamoyladenosine biosynthesis protein TsaB